MKVIEVDSYDLDRERGFYLIDYNKMRLFNNITSREGRISSFFFSCLR